MLELKSSIIHEALKHYMRHLQLTLGSITLANQERSRVHELYPEYAPNLLVRLARMSEKGEAECVEWTGALDRWGYGKMKVKDEFGKIRTVGPHRAAWLATHGRIEGDLVIDHLCRNRKCVNVEHLRLVTNAVNTLAGDHSTKKGRSGRKRGAKPGCSKHGQEDGRWRVRKDGYERWDCRICRRERQRRFRAKRKSEKQ